MIQKTSSPLYVFSHPRSGTHFLGCALSLNFDLEVRPQTIDRDYFRRDPPRFLTASGESDDVPWGSLVAHEQVHRFYDHVTEESAPRVYIYRRCADVMASVYRWKMLRNHRDEELLEDESLSFEEFLRRPLAWQESVHTRARFDLNPIEHWAFHVSGWLESGELCVRYEDLIDRYEESLAEIGERFGLSRLSGSFVPVPGRVGYNPGTTATRTDDEAGERLVDEALRRLAPIYPAAAREQPDAIEDAALLARHRTTLFQHGREVCRLERRIEELERERDRLGCDLASSQRRADLYEQRYHHTTDELRAAENLMERRQAALRDFLGRLWHELATSQD